MITGTAYGTALNDRSQLDASRDLFSAPPYNAPPKAPVLYIKPRSCFGFAGAPIRLPAYLSEVEAAPTIGLLFARDLTAGNADSVMDAVGAVCLALDISEPNSSYYRPAVRHRCRDGFLPLGALVAPPIMFGELVTEIDGREIHRWSLERLFRPVKHLLADVTAFMTLQAGDLFLVGLPGDAPRLRVGQHISVMSEGLPTVHTQAIRQGAE